VDSAKNILSAPKNNNVMRSSPMIQELRFPLDRGAVFSEGERLEVRLMPSGVSSKAHAKIKAIGNPVMRKMIIIFMTQSGAAKASVAMENIWVISHAVMA